MQGAENLVRKQYLIAPRQVEKFKFWLKNKKHPLPKLYAWPLTHLILMCQQS